MKSPDSKTKLPDYYPCVALDIMELCNRTHGLCMDLGCGQGQVGLELAQLSDCRLIMADPNRKALAKALNRSLELGLGERSTAISCRAEKLPMRENSLDLVISRGSIFFWDDQRAGLKEIRRVLRPGGEAMVGGGMGKTYPLWARRQFTQRRRRAVRKKGPGAVENFTKMRDPETFARWAREAGLTGFQVVGEGGLPPSDPRTGLGIWLLFRKRRD